MNYNFLVRGRLHKTEPPKLLKDRFCLVAKSLVFPKQHYLFDIFDKKLQQYIEGNFIGYNLRSWAEEGNPKRFAVDKEPFAVLTLGELEAGFVVCLVPLVLSIVVCAIEWMPTLKNLVVFLIIFQKLFDMKKSEQSNHSKMMKNKFAQWQADKKRKEKTNRDNTRIAAAFLKSILDTRLLVQ